MSSTRNSQNLLVNVFRPTYVFDGCGFSAGVVATNIKTLDVPTVRATTVTMGDAGGNVYIGTGSGVAYSVSLSNSSNSAFGVNAAAGINNVQNGVFIGANAGVANSSSSNTIIIGANANAFGTKNIVIGNGSYASGSNNIIIGTDISLSASYKLRIGSIITADLSSSASMQVGGVTRFDASVGIFRDPTYNLDVSNTFRVSDANGSLVFSNGKTLSSFQTSNGIVNIPLGSSSRIYKVVSIGLYSLAAKNTYSVNDYVHGRIFVIDPSMGTFAPSVSVIKAGDLDVGADSSGYFILSNTSAYDISASWSLLFQPL